MKTKSDIGACIRRRVYSDLLAEGYRMRYNISKEDAEQEAKRLRDFGLDVQIAEKAFWEDGTEDPNLRAILVRDNQVSRLIF